MEQPQVGVVTEVAVDRNQPEFGFNFHGVMSTRSQSLPGVFWQERSPLFMDQIKQPLTGDICSDRVRWRETGRKLNVINEILHPLLLLNLRIGGMSFVIA